MKLKEIVCEGMDCIGLTLQKDGKQRSFNVVTSCTQDMKTLVCSV
jgi:hypothetical protein